MLWADNDPALVTMLTITARSAGVTIDADTVTRLAPVLASLLDDWKTLARAVPQEVEPMSVGLWPGEQP